MAHLALYRKHRPTSFLELVGQPGVSRTLSRALEQDRLAHAYLFCGPRGTGKTSVARILARGINCEKGPTPSPCGACASCVAISEGRHLDVVEIDAASHNGVDHVRDLQDRVALAPAQGRRKVYIVDEVHMLSTGAFNALLKTLEEPPAHVVFILATTDPHKVLPTIVSRCQRFDFGRIPLPDLLARLAWVLEQEGLSADPDALDAIARRAQGGLRDALSLLDQVVAVAEGQHLGAAEVAAALGLADGRQVAALAAALLQGQGEEALTIAQLLQASGQEATGVLRELAGAIRHALVLSLAPQQAHALEVPAAMVEILGPLASGLSLAEGAWLTEAMQDAEALLRRSPQAGPWLDLTLLRLAARPPMPSLLALSERVGALEARLEGRALPPAPVPKAASLRPTPMPDGGSRGPDAPRAPQLEDARPALQVPASPEVVGPTGPPVLGSEVASVLPTRHPTGQAGPEFTREAERGASSVSPDPVVEQPTVVPAIAGASNSKALLEGWAEVMLILKEQHRPTAALLEQHASPLRLADGQLFLKLAKTFQQMFERQANKRELLSGAIAQVFGEQVQVGTNFRFELEAGANDSKAPASAPPTPPKLALPPALQQAESRAMGPGPAGPEAPSLKPELPERPPASPHPVADRAAAADAMPPTTVSPEARPMVATAPMPVDPAPSPQAKPVGSPNALDGDGDEALRLAVQHFKGRVKRRPY